MKDHTVSKQERSAFSDIIAALMRYGKESSPRGLLIKEVNNFWYNLPPYVRFMRFKERKLNLDYIKKEFLWYLRGDKYDTSIGESAKMWLDIVNKDGSINSNYGQYIFGDQQQFWNVVRILENDKDSRRASISILNSDHLMSDTKDVPCTYSLNFRIREHRLEMTVHMRSQDAIFGMGNDAPAFSFIHEMVYEALKPTYEGLICGRYFHIADSFHVYEKHFEMAKKIASGECEFIETDCPKISGIDEVKFLTTKHDVTLDEIPDEFAFTKWLYTYDK